MTTPRLLSQSRTYPVDVGHAFSLVMSAPLEKVFARRYAALPAVRGVRGQEGRWATEGQTRTILLADGGSMREELTSVVEGCAFGYHIDQVTGPMRPLVASLEGRWAFAPVGTGTRVTWSWTLLPASSVAAGAMPLFARLWRGYARQALEEVETLLVDA